MRASFREELLFISFWLTALAFASPCSEGEVQITQLSSGFINVWVLEGAEGTVIVDSREQGDAADIVRSLEKHDVDLEKVHGIVLTHGHADHAGGATELSALLDVPVWVGEEDAAYLKAGANPTLQPTAGLGRRLHGQFQHDTWTPLPDAVPITGTTDLSALGVVGEVRLVGQHTPTSLIIDLGDGRIVVGDLVRGGIARKHRARLHFFMDDVDGAHGVLQQLIDDGNQCFFPGHGGPLSAKRVQSYLDRHPPSSAGEG